MKTETTITIATSEGAAEATRYEGRDGRWHIAYPWRDEDFFGTSAEVRSRMTRAIKNFEKENTA